MARPMECGVDEAGRGPLAGPVVAAAVILGSGGVDGVADSKKLNPARREEIALLLREKVFAWSVGVACVADIDRINIHHATLLAMRRAVLGLHTAPAMVLVDGCHAPALPMAARTVVGGDSRVTAIAAASIIAKTYRDYLMRRLAEQYPGYGFERHKGYPTREHLQGLRKLGVTSQHRRSYRPVREIVDGVQF